MTSALLNVHLNIGVCKSNCMGVYVCMCVTVCRWVNGCECMSMWI